MLVSVKAACELQDNVLEFALGDQIEEITELATADKAAAQAFFERNFVTKGMATLLRMGLSRIAGKEGQAVFELRQAMGGGKTHSMLALGFLARFPELRYSIPEEVTKGASWGAADVVAVTGRKNYAERFIWGEIARQLGADDQWRKFWINGPSAPDEDDWIALFGDRSVLILLDELPPYFDYAYTRSVGDGNLAQVTTYALSTMMSAVLKCPRVCVVISNLSGSYENASKDLTKAIGNFIQEAGRQAKGITPVELGSSEIFDILRKRLFKTTDDTIRDSVADAYGKALSEAIQARSIPKSADQVKDEIYASYPFHPGLKSVIALFKENEKYRQTRGLMQFVSRIIKSIWESPSNDVFLIGPQHLKLNIADVREEVNRIAPSLQSAIAQDIAANGEAYAEQIDAASGSDAGSQVASLLLVSSLSDSLDSVKGLTRDRMLEMLVAPYRGASEFEDAFDALKARSWYLHKKDNDVWYFSDLENLRKRIDSLASKAPQGSVDSLVRKKLESVFEARSRNAYQKVEALPEVESLTLAGGDRYCLVMSPDTRIPPEAAKRFWDSITSKNAICIVTGEGGNLVSINDRAARVWAIAKVEAEMKASNQLKHHEEELENERSQASYDLHSAIVNIFNRVLYPGRDAAKKDALLFTRLELTFGDEGFDGEAAVEKALSGTDASKLETDVAGKADALIKQAEILLWPSNKDIRRIPWRDVTDGAISNPRWQWLPPKSLDTLRAKAVALGVWRHTEDGYVEKGPFPPARTEVHIVDDEADHDRETGAAGLKVTARNAGPNGRVHYATTPSVDAGCPAVEDGALTTSATELWFVAVDPEGKHEKGDVRHWKNSLQIKHQPHFAGGVRTVELKVVPPADIRWNTDGTNARDGQPYEGPISLPGTKEQAIWVHARIGSLEATAKFVISGSAEDGPVVDQASPAVLKRKVTITGSADVFQSIKTMEKRETKASGITVIVGEGDRTMRFNVGSGASVSSAEFTRMIEFGRTVVGDVAADVEIVLSKIDFSSGHDLVEFARERGFDVSTGEIIQ